MNAITKFFAVITAILFGSGVYAQISIDQTMTPEELVQNVLVGSGVTVSNVLYNGTVAGAQSPQVNVAQFDQNGTAFPLAEGLILTTGNANVAIGPNEEGGQSDPTGTSTVSDPDLDAISTNTINNGVDLEFDFVPAGDTLEFQYVFASEEYPEFSPSSFNDAFGFFISGPGLAGPFENGGENIALIPGTATPVTINNINPTTNQTYYVDNAGSMDIEYDGRTVTLLAKIGVQCGETYHIKMVIGNAGDQGWDSGVFLEANSFSSNTVDVAVATVTGDTTLVEGCGVAEIIFSRPDNQTDSALTINFDILGDAINGTDFTQIDTFITFPIGEDTMTLSLNPLADGDVEGPETVTIIAYTINSCGDTLATSGTVYIVDEPDIQISVMDTLINCPNDSVWNGGIASGGHEPYEYSWSNGVDADSAFFDGTMVGDTIYYITATDDCGFSHTDSFTLTLNPAFYIDTILIQDSECVLPPNQGTGSVAALMEPIANPYSYNWTNADGSEDINASAWSDLNPGWYYFTVSFEGCTLTDSALVGMDNPPVASYTASPTSGIAPLGVVFDNNSTGATNYDWNLITDTFSINNSSSQTATYTEAGDYPTQLIAYNDLGCSDTAWVTVSVIEFNPIIFDQPNVFTPNGDGENDLFTLNVQNSENYEIQVRNRWGNVIVTLDQNNPTWDGKTKSGGECAEATYFYNYVINPLDESLEVVQGQGFVVLKRN